MLTCIRYNICTSCIRKPDSMRKLNKFSAKSQILAKIIEVPSICSVPVEVSSNSVKHHKYRLIPFPVCRRYITDTIS